ncbi:sulfotransferase family protein [Microbulbifer variabilis]|uniref:sulfotransferase family protein n=1 Tax=Microbulbifer variabilis TaxID=266805 RepID=UPI001CFC5B68|nr:sulfotransferase family protein [Microbulbifer variabilis]
MTTKVFCIGFHKTGTSSLAEALKMLGYKVTGPNGVGDPDISNNVYRMAFQLVDKFDAFQDNPWPLLFKIMDAKCPGSKFILTVREPRAWIESVVKHFGRRETPMRKWIYGLGMPEGNEGIYMKRYNAHNNEVLDYFEARPRDLLIMDLAKGSGWKELCGFLEKQIPNIPFPHANKALDRC